MLESSTCHPFLIEKAFRSGLLNEAIEGAMKDEGELATALREADASQVAYMLHQADWYQRAQNTLRRMHRLSSVKHEVHSLSGKQVGVL